MIITLSGDLGSGKSSVAKAIEKEGYARIAIGDTWREMAAEKGMSIHEMNAHVIDHPEMDREMDERVAAKARQAGTCVVEGRAQFYFLPESVKIYLATDLKVAAQRIFAQNRDSEKENVSYEATLAATKKRSAHDKERFLDRYGIDFTDPKHYDLVLECSQLTVPETVNLVKEFLLNRH